MALAHYKDLCIDTNSEETLGRFWAAALGLKFNADGDGGDLGGATPEQKVWMNSVEEPKTVKHRVHLDVHAASVEELVELGATVLEPAADHPGRGWTVMADPEGGEFCAFVREVDALPSYRLYEIVVDAADPRLLATWWADVLGVELGGDQEKGWWWLEQVSGMPFEGWCFIPVPEPKAVKNRIHWDVTVESLDLLIGAGATVIRPRDDEISWTICADPEGNEFCAFTAENDAPAEQ